MNEVQKIVLTCLLGPEDPGSFRRFQKQKWKSSHRDNENRGVKERYWKDPEGSRERNRIRDRARRPSIRARRTKKYRECPRYRLESNLRSRVINAVNGASSKSARTAELLGAPWAWVESHLESLFKPGMSWENYGPVWHIDHKRPCAAFDLTDPEQQRICFHWTNLQPLFAQENLQKSDKYVL